MHCTEEGQHVWASERECCDGATRAHSWVTRPLTHWMPVHGTGWPQGSLERPDTPPEPVLASADCHKVRVRVSGRLAMLRGGLRDL